MHDALLDKVAWIGHDNVLGPIRGIALRFSGLGSTGMKDGPDDMEGEWAQAGALVVTPYHDPWGWMNPATRAFTDEILDGLRVRYSLPADIPIIATGCSMGGYGALIYARYAPRVNACLALSPACDLPFHYGERPDLPRTLHHAFRSYGDIGEDLKRHSPVHQAAQMPDIPYLVIHGGKDEAVNKSRHSDALVAAMRAAGLTVDYQERPNMGHCGPLDDALKQHMTAFIVAALRG